MSRHVRHCWADLEPLDSDILLIAQPKPNHVEHCYCIVLKLLLVFVGIKMHEFYGRGGGACWYASYYLQAKFHAWWTSVDIPNSRLN